MKITIPELSLVCLIGASGCGKSTFARKHFKRTEVVSSDFCRGLVSDDENDQAATKDAFELLHFILAKRLAAAKLTVVDATNVQPEARKPLVELARKYHCLPVAIVFNLPEKLCHERNRNRPDRNFGPHVVRNQSAQLRRSLRGLEREGFRHVFVLSSAEQIDQVEITRDRLWNNKRDEHGPFDIIGDVHGCFDELCTLLQKLGYAVTANDGSFSAIPPAGRKAVFVGDLVDRGPGVAQVLKLVMDMVSKGHAYCVPGNHDAKLLRKLRGKDVKLTHGLAETMAQLDPEPVEFKKVVAEFIDDLVSHYVFDEGKLVVAHAGLREEMQGRGSGKVREFAMYGETTGETDEYGLPVRYNWAAEYRGRALVVYGHTPVAEPEFLNGTINIDTGCVFGGKLTGFRYPERELVSVPAVRVHYEPLKPLVPAAPAALSVQHELDDVLDIQDVIGKRIVETRLAPKITLREENSIAALEVMSRFAANPKWLIYIPPTMSPTETSKEPELLEHPAEAFRYFSDAGVAKVVCEEKHMGSRAVVIICRDDASAAQRFGVTGEGIGIVLTRTGRPFFNDAALHTAFLDRLRTALDRADFWSEFNTTWFCFDCELMPWSAKAQELLKQQYAPVAAAARAGFHDAISALQNSHQPDLLDRWQKRREAADRYSNAYAHYCWTVNSLADLKLAPFHILATEGAVHTDKDHVWHMETLARWCAQDAELLRATPYVVVDLAEPASVSAATDWWIALTAKGGEGMVVKPLDFVSRNDHGLIQPAVKCRGVEYLRIIYGPEYTLPEHMQRLRHRSVKGKRSLALREFALGVESLERFVRREPLRRVHECVFGVLALESEPVDPRL
jgi:protein phosphatase